MTKIVSLFSAVAMIMFAPLCAEAVQATATRTWVSGAGKDSNPCTRALPCATFEFAYGATSAGGEIDVLDGGEFGPVNINKAITIANDGAGTAAISANGASDAINIQANSSDAVVLRGLTLRGDGSPNNGIWFLAGGSLLVDHCKIQGFQSNQGIWFQPSLAAGKLSVTDTVLSNSGTAMSASVWIEPLGFAATVRFERVQVLQGIGNGIRVDGTSGGAVDVELHDVTVDGATGGSGIAVVSQTSGGPTVKLVADNVTASHNAGYGFRAVGGTASVYLRRSTIEDNGVGIGASSGGVVYSYGDNSFAGNISGDGVTPTPIGLK